MSVQQLRLELDSNVRRISHGTALLGGSPFRLVRLSDTGSRLLDAWLAGNATAASPAADALRDRLLQASLVHPVVEPGSDQQIPSVSFVIPVHNDAAGLDAVLKVLRRDFIFVEIVVVDDASTDAAAIARVVEAHDAQLIRHEFNRGPAAARNTGWRNIAPAGSKHYPDVIFFLDADVVPMRSALRRTLNHFGDPKVSAAAPRVRAQPGPGFIDSYEAMSSPLDLGPASGPVRPGSRLSYVPSAALAIRTEALIDAGGFDEQMRYGEDVDLMWRLADDGQTIRYEANAVTHHRNRSTVRELAKQRFGYGSSAGPLASRHGATMTPLRMPATILAGWMAALTAGPVGVAVGLGGAAWSWRTLSTKFDGKVDQPITEAGRTLVSAHTGVASALVNATNRHYVPLMLLTRRSRRLLMAGAVIPPLIEWLRRRPSHDPVRHVVAKAIDDTSYAAGVWVGAWRERSLGALLPDVQLPTDITESAT